MGFDSSRFVVGDEWAYRARDNAVSERVRILAVTPKKNSARLDVAFIDDPATRTENVTGNRLRVPWDEVAAYDELMANWHRIDDRNLDNTEEACVEQVYQLLIPEDVAEMEWSPVSCATTVHDATRLAEITHRPIEEILVGVEWFDLNASKMVSPAGTLLLAELACRANPTPVLNIIMEEEAACRRKCKHGSEELNVLTREKEWSSPEWEYDKYRRWNRPQHELLRQWCGHGAVTSHERLLAAEAENNRLDVLVAEVIAALERAGEDWHSTRFAEEHERDRITPWTIRTVVDRPLHPSEIPVREVPVRRRWPR
ncbi:hypothetical protein AB0B86_05770 [Micromonospora sp. NPDC049047]|uniref:hypothetical protein n=1 Tax=Micromonospora sp. NPDC049047 TaxID=3155645 RepID=UPI0033F1A9E9